MKKAFQELFLEYDVINRLKPAIILCREKQDSTTANIFEKIEADEEDHIDYLETQLELMDKLGDALYAAQCVSRPPDHI
jgi:bacterioferritin